MFSVFKFHISYHLSHNFLRCVSKYCLKSNKNGFVSHLGHKTITMIKIRQFNESEIFKKKNNFTFLFCHLLINELIFLIYDSLKKK